jgi:hypothetical protein
MIYHFINLVTINSVACLYHETTKSENVEISVDSISLKLVLMLRGIKRKRISGIRAALKLQWSFQNLHLDAKKTLFILHSDKQVLPTSTKLVAPMLTDENIPDYVTSITDSVKSHEMILIGIGGPRHDQLGFYIHLLFPDKKIYCLGAALDAVLLNNDNRISLFDRLGLNFLNFLIVNPKRFLIKVTQSLYAGMKLKQTLSNMEIESLVNETK